jgi:hypothetical protein
MTYSITNIKYLENIFEQIENIQILIDDIKQLQLQNKNITNFYKIIYLKLQIIKLKKDAKEIANNLAGFI